MPVNIGKNLKIEPTNDTKVSKFVRNYKQIHDYIDEQYQSEESNVILYDLLTSLIPTAVIEYSGLPIGTTFVWKIGNETLTNPATVKEGQIVDYTLTYSNGSKCVDSFTVTGDVALDLSELEANKFNLTITANKTLSTVRVYHNWSSGSTNYEDITTFTNNTAVVECNKNENVKVYASSDGWSQIAQTPDFMNLSLNPHDYSNIIQNISETYNFTYESYSTQRIYLKDDNDNYIDMSSTYLNYITWNPSDSTKFVSNGIIFDGSNPDYYNSYKDKSISVDYTINVPGYAQITGTFGSTVSPSRDNQTKTLVQIVTYTVTPDPIGATVTLAATGYTTVSGTGTQSITVAKGTTINRIISLSGYNTINDEVTPNTDVSVTEPLTPSFTPETRTFNYTGAVQTYTVPQGCNHIIVDCVGAAGYVPTYSGTVFTTPNCGKGGRVQCKLAVTPDQILNIYVGGNNGYNGGGSSTQGYGNGGGASDIRIGGTSLTDRKVVAGAGGAGYGGQWAVKGGDGGGLTGGNGQGEYGTGASGGTQSAGGAGGINDPYNAYYGGGAGSLGQGGSGESLPGGGGYYGGGCGSSGAYDVPIGSGAGGSSYTDSTLCTDVVHTQGYSEATGNGWITITTSNE